MNRVYLYGIAGAEDQYRIAWYQYLEGEQVTVRNMVQTASWMKYKNGSIKEVYAVDDSQTLYRDYKRATKANSIEGNVIFKYMLETNGLKVI